MELKKRIILFLILFFVPIFGIWIFQDKYLVINGETMGTTYTIKIYVDSWRTKSSIEQQFNKVFKSVNDTFSTWNDTSELSRFNQMESTEFVSISPELYKVLNTSSKMYEISKGAFDPSVKPLLDLWGFGKNNIYFEVPQSNDIENIKKFVGYNKIIIEDNRVRKLHPQVSLDLSSLVKGYSVDKVVELLNEIGVSKYMIEVGGEVRVGENKSKPFWNIGILEPSVLNTQSQLLLTLKVKNQSIATSGDYKNYFEKDGKIFSHIFDPRHGKPIFNNIASVTVIAEDCMIADALATALSVIGVSRGLSIIESFDNVECVFVVRDKQNKLTAYPSSGFSNFVVASEISI